MRLVSYEYEKINRIVNVYILKGPLITSQGVFGKEKKSTLFLNIFLKKTKEKLIKKNTLLGYDTNYYLIWVNNYVQTPFEELKQRK